MAQSLLINCIGAITMVFYVLLLCCHEAEGAVSFLAARELKAFPGKCYHDSKDGKDNTILDVNAEYKLSNECVRLRCIKTGHRLLFEHHTCPTLTPREIPSGCYLGEPNPKGTYPQCCMSAIKCVGEEDDDDEDDEEADSANR